jgi:sucrose phosphorylase
MRPERSVNPLDTHDGIGITDVGADGDRPGLLPDDRLRALVDGIERRSGGTANLARAGSSALGVYQVNCTYYDALGGDDARYLVARLVQALAPGIPQVYYVGLLAGSNDVERYRRTGAGRDVNRHHYTPDELDAALARPVVRDLLALLRWRARCPTFAGTFDVLDGADHELAVRWRRDDDSVEARIDLATAAFAVTERVGGSTRVVRSVGDL